MPKASPSKFDRPLLAVAGLALTLTVCLGGAPDAQAQDHAERMANIAADHARQMNDYGYMAAQNYANSQEEFYPEEEDTGYYSSYGSIGPITPITLEMQYLIESARRELDEIDAVHADPRYRRYADGGWDYYQSRSPAGPGEFCAATYLNRDGMITLTGVDSSWDGAMLMFVGANIPKPESFREISASLAQNGEAPATVRVYNYQRKPEMPEVGTLVFAVPAMEAALAGMSDELEFAISIEGREVFRMSWKDGLAARDELRKCLRQRRR